MEGVDVLRGRLGVDGVAGEAGLTVIPLCGDAGRLPALPRPLLLSRSRSRSRSRSLRFVGVRSRDPEAEPDTSPALVISAGGDAMPPPPPPLGEDPFDLRRCGAGGGVDGLLRFSATLTTGYSRHGKKNIVVNAGDPCIYKEHTCTLD